MMYTFPFRLLFCIALTDLTHYNVKAKELKEVKSFHDFFKDSPVISLQETLKEIYSEPKFEI